jgi:tRNA(fMet)-specific endonuclease VapC
MRILLDTNVYVALMRGNPGVAARVRGSELVLLSTVVAGELLFGFYHGSRLEKNLRQLGEFLENPFVELIPVTYTTADRFGRISAALRSKGRPLPTNDIWIAAHTMETGAELLSFDQHFSHIDGLVWTRPSSETR